MVKLCPKCLQEKDCSCFGKNKNNKDGLSRWCRQCRGDFDKSGRSNNRCLGCGKGTQGVRCVECARKSRIKSRLCSVEGCNNKHHAKGLCSYRYQRQYGRLGPIVRGRFRRKKRSGGCTIKDKGYRVISCPCHPNADRDGYVLEHRLIMEVFLSRLLSRNEVVHHKDGNKLNNAIENLEILSSKSEHSRLHALDVESNFFGRKARCA